MAVSQSNGDPNLIHGDTDRASGPGRAGTAGPGPQRRGVTPMFGEGWSTATQAEVAARRKWFAELKAGRTYVGGKAFDSKREAQAWYERERAALAGGVDPRAGRATVRTLLPVWLDERRHSVSAKTYTADAALPRLVPTALAALRIAAVTDR